jgi:Ig-like domain-containing protein
MKPTLLIAFLVVPLLLTACGPAPAQPTPDTGFIQTSAASTVIANFTRTAAAAVTFTPLPALTSAATPLETQTQAPPASPAVGTPTLLPGGVTATPGLCDYYTWDPATVDVNIPDGSQMTPGQQFVKTWRIKNAGICTWGSGYKMVYAGYSDLMSGIPQPINGVIGPGQEIEISVQFKAPAKAGEYVSAWTMQNAAGIKFFGIGAKPLYVKIVVKL